MRLAQKIQGEWLLLDPISSVLDRPRAQTHNSGLLEPVCGEEVPKRSSSVKQPSGTEMSSMCKQKSGRRFFRLRNLCISIPRSCYQLVSRTDEAAQTSHLSPSRRSARKSALASQRTAYVNARNWARADASASGDMSVESACMT